MMPDSVYQFGVTLTDWIARNLLEVTIGLIVANGVIWVYSAYRLACISRASGHGHGHGRR